MGENTKYEIVKLADDFYTIDEGGVRSFLFVGTEKAFLIDTGFSDGIKAEVDKLTSLPVMLINTHADMDHTGGNADFGVAYMHEAEFEHYRRDYGEEVPCAAIVPGQIVDTGIRKLEVLWTPGHTPGSISLLDRENRILVGGDAIQTGAIFMFGPERDVDTYITSMEELIGKADLFDVIYPSHADYPVTPEILPKLLQGICDIRDGKMKGTPLELFGNKVVNYDIGAAKFIMEE